MRGGETEVVAEQRLEGGGRRRVDDGEQPEETAPLTPLELLDVALRREIADKRDVPAYVIFSDVSLREMARSYPTTAVEFGRVSGVGQQKQRDFAEPFIDGIKDYLASNSKPTFRARQG